MNLLLSLSRSGRFGNIATYPTFIGVFFMFSWAKKLIKIEFLYIAGFALKSLLIILSDKTVRFCF